MRSFFSHVSINVPAVEKSRKFYDAVMPQLGFRLLDAGEDYAGYMGTGMSVWLIKCPPRLAGKKQKRGVPGYDHVAFAAPSRRDVDRLDAFLRKRRFRILYPAEEHPEFVKGYYSVSFKDPDGIVIEYVYVPGRLREQGFS